MDVVDCDCEWCQNAPGWVLVSHPKKRKTYGCKKKARVSMGCNADKDMKSDLPCWHEHVLECRNCRLDFTVTYTDGVIQLILDRVKAIEAKLGAATSGVGSVGAADCSDVHAMSGQSIRQAGESASVPTAAPSVSAADYKTESRYLRAHGSTYAADACDLAAAVTEWARSPSWGVEKDNDQLRDIALAFVRGEPLPQKGG